MAKNTIGKRDLKKECLYTKLEKYLQQLRINSGEEEMTKEHGGHEFSDNRKKQVENKREKVLFINNIKPYRVSFARE